MTVKLITCYGKLVGKQGCPICKRKPPHLRRPLVPTKGGGLRKSSMDNSTPLLSANSSKGKYQRGGIHRNVCHLRAVSSLTPSSVAKFRIDTQKSVMIKNKEIISHMSRVFNSGEFLALKKHRQKRYKRRMIMITKAQFRKVFQHRMRTARENAGLSRTQIALVLGVYDDTYKHWEINKSASMPAMYMARFAAITNTNLDHLLNPLATGNEVDIAKSQQKVAKGKTA